MDLSSTYQDYDIPKKAGFSIFTGTMAAAGLYFTYQGLKQSDGYIASEGAAVATFSGLAFYGTIEELASDILE